MTRTPDRTARDTYVDTGLWCLTGLMLAGIAYWSLTPSPSLPSPFPQADKVYHALAYAGLTICVLLTAVWRPGRGSGPLPHAWTVVAGAIALGVALEVVQAFVHRDPDLFDALADAVGVLVGYGAWRALGGTDHPSEE